MSARNATKNALLTYIRADPEPRPLVQIERYMHVMHGVSRGATCTALWRLAREGKIIRTTPGFYQISAPPD